MFCVLRRKPRRRDLWSKTALGHLFLCLSSPLSNKAPAKSIWQNLPMLCIWPPELLIGSLFVFNCLFTQLILARSMFCLVPRILLSRCFCSGFHPPPPALFLDFSTHLVQSELDPLSLPPFRPLKFGLLYGLNEVNHQVKHEH